MKVSLTPHQDPTSSHFLLLGSVHGVQSYLVILVAVILTVVDLFSIIKRVVSFIRSGEKFALHTFWNVTILGGEQPWLKDSSAEYAGLVTEEPEEYELDDTKAAATSPTASERHVHYDEATIHGSTEQWANNVNRHHRNYSQSAASDNTLCGERSVHSEDTLDGLDFNKSTPKQSLPQRIGNGVFATVERLLVVVGFAQLILGIVIYTGAYPKGSSPLN